MAQAHEIYRITVNGQQNFEVDGDSLDFLPSGPDTFHVLLDGKRFNAKLLQADYHNKAFEFVINGSVYHVVLADEYDQLVDRLGLAKHTITKIKEIKAPMPGLVLEISVKEGDTVEKGQSLLILEAMKMENVLKSPGDGVVKRIFVNKGQPVDKNQLLVEMD